MNPASRFSYACNQCGRCCHDQVITLSPYDLIRIARAAGLSTAAARERFTLRRGSILRFGNDGACIALDRLRCTIHAGRPLACRLYPLGMEHLIDGASSFTRLGAAPGSRGVYGTDGTIADFLKTQEVKPYLKALEAYRGLLPLMSTRVSTLTDFDLVEPREFWRVATREALAESNFDPNPLIDALYDPDACDGQRGPIARTVTRHIAAIEALVEDMHDAAVLAAAAVMLAAGLGYSPETVRIDKKKLLIPF